MTFSFLPVCACRCAQSSASSLTYIAASCFLHLTQRKSTDVASTSRTWYIGILCITVTPQKQPGQPMGNSILLALRTAEHRSSLSNEALRFENKRWRFSVLGIETIAQSLLCRPPTIALQRETTGDDIIGSFPASNSPVAGILSLAVATFLLQPTSQPTSTPNRGQSRMPTMSGRTRPIEKFAAAAAKCSVEVSLDSDEYLFFDRFGGIEISSS